MLAFATSLILFAGGGGGVYDTIFNIPGFELWKFINLALFVGIMIYLTKKPLSEAFKAKREQIRAELIKAEEEKKAALEKLTAAEAKLAQLENEKEHILKRAEEEAAFEANRIAEATAVEVERLRQQNEAELTRLTALAKADLRRYSAEESIRLAEAKLRKDLDAQSDVKLVKASIQEIGGLN